MVLFLEDKDLLGGISSSIKENTLLISHTSIFTTYIMSTKGMTPQRKNYLYPSALVRTQPREQLLDRSSASARVMLPRRGKAWGGACVWQVEGSGRSQKARDLPSLTGW